MPRSVVKMQYGQQQYSQQSYDQGYNGAPPVWLVRGINGCCYPVSNGQQQVIGRYDMPQTRGRPAYYVSREQCVIQVGFDGTAALTSIGKPPTGWRVAPGQPWQWLRKDAKAPIFLPDGAQLSLNKYDKEGAIFTIEIERAGWLGQQVGFPPPQQGGFPPPAQQQGGFGQPYGGVGEQSGEFGTRDDSPSVW